MSAVSDRFNKTMTNQMYVNSLADDGAICSYTQKKYDEQATYKGGQGPRQIFQVLNNRVNLYHKFLKYLLGEERQELKEAIPVIDYFNPDNSSFLYTYPVKNGEVESTEIIKTPKENIINYALAGEAEAEYFYNTRSSVSSQFNIQAGYINETGWTYEGYITTYNIINGQPSYNLRALPLQFYQCNEDSVTIGLDYLDYGQLAEKEILEPYDENSTLFIEGTSEGGLQRFKGISYNSKSSSAIMLTTPTYYYGLPTLGQQGDSLGPAPTDRTWNSVTLSKNDFIFLLPGDSSDFSVKNRVLIFKYIGFSEEEQTILKYPIDWSRVSDSDLIHADPKPEQEIKNTDNLQIGPYLVFMAYLYDIQADIPWKTIEVGELVPDSVQELLDQSPYMFNDLLHFERSLFGPASGIMNGLFSVPYEYDKTISEAQAAINFGNDELKYPRVIKWKFDNDVDKAAFRGMTIAAGSHYFPGHLLNRGTIIGSPLKRSLKDPVAKLKHKNTSGNWEVIAFKYADGLYKTSAAKHAQYNPDGLVKELYLYTNPVTGITEALPTNAPVPANIWLNETIAADIAGPHNYYEEVPYLGKSEIIYDMLNSFDISQALYSKFTDFYSTAANSTIPTYLSTMGLVTFDDFPTDASELEEISYYPNMRYPKRLLNSFGKNERATETLVGLSSQIESLLAQLESGSSNILSSTSTSVTAINQTGSVTYGSRYTAEDIKVYIDSFFDCFKPSSNNPSKKCVCLDYRNPNDPGLYNSYEEYGEYQRYTGETELEYWKGDKQVSEGTKGATTKVIQKTEKITATQNLLQYDTITDLEENGRKSFHLTYHHFYTSTGVNNTPVKPQIYKLYNKKKIESTAVNGIEYNSQGQEVSSDDSAIAFGLEPLLRVITPMDTFSRSVRQKRHASLNQAKQVLVYPATKQEFPESLFLFSKTDLEIATGKPGAPSVLRNNKSVPVIFFNPESKDFLMLQAVNAWHYNYDDIEEIEFYTPETEEFKLTRKNPIIWYKEQIAHLEDVIYEEERSLRRGNQYDQITVKHKYALNQQTGSDYYIISYPKQAGDSWSLSFDKDSEEYNIIKKLLKDLTGTSFSNLQAFLRNWSFIAQNVEEEDIEDLDINDDFKNLFLDILTWAERKATLEANNNLLKNYQAKVKNITSQLNERYHDYTQEFYCYQLQPVPLSLDLEKAITIYQQELDSTDHSDPMEFDGLGNQLHFDFGPVSSSDQYFKIGKWNPETRVYERPLEVLGKVKEEFKKLGTSEIIFRLPDLQAHNPAWYKYFGNSEFYKAFGTFIDDAMNNPKSSLRRATNQITQNILSQFQLSKLSTGAPGTPLMLTELPQILFALQALKEPISALALTQTKFPLNGLSTKSYSPDILDSLGDLSQLLLRYEHDLEYTALDTFPQEADYKVLLNWTAVTFEALGDDIYQFTYKPANQILGQAQTKLIRSTTYTETNPFTELRTPCQSTLLPANTLNLAEGFKWIATAATNPPENYERLVKNINKLFHCVFKAWIIPQLTLKPTDASTRPTKKQRSFKYLEQNFGTALSTANTDGFTETLCRKLDEQFGDNTRPFLNMQKESCSLPVDNSVEEMKQNYNNYVGKATTAIIANLQDAVNEVAIADLNTLWNTYFESPAEDWRSALYTVAIDELTSEFKVNFMSLPVQTLINTLIKSGYIDDHDSYITYSPVAALLQFITPVTERNLANARDTQGKIILPNSVTEFKAKEHTAPDPGEDTPYFLYEETQSLAAYFEAWQEQGVMPEELRNLINSLDINASSSLNSKDAILKNLTDLYQILRAYAIPGAYNDQVLESGIVPELASKALTEYLAKMDFKNPKTFKFYELINSADEPDEAVYLKINNEYIGPIYKQNSTDSSKYELLTSADTGIPVYKYDTENQSYIQVLSSIGQELRYKQRWGWYEPSADGVNQNNFYFLPVYCEDLSSKYRVSPAKKTKYNAVYHNYYAVTLSLHLPDFIYDTEKETYILKASDLDLTGAQASKDPETDILPTFDVLADESAIFQATLPVPNGSNFDVSEVLLQAIADSVKEALTGANQDQNPDDVAVRLLETDEEPQGNSDSLYFKRYQALNARLNRISGPLYSAARALQGRKQVDKVSKAGTTALSVYSDLMKVIPVVQFDAMTYLAGQDATASTIPLDGRFYYNDEMESLRRQISDKCVLTCHSCTVKNACPFYNEEEILKYYCPPAGWLNLYFKDNKLDLLYYDDNPNYLSPNIYEYEKTETGKKQIGDSIPAEYFKALHKPYSEVIRRTEEDENDWIAPVRPLRKTVGQNNDQIYSLPALEEELQQSTRLHWNEQVDGDISWLTNARYGTIEANNSATIFNNQYTSLDLKPYNYLHNAVYVFDEETEFEYTASPDFYEVDDLYLTDPAGEEHRYGGRTRIWLPSTLKAFIEADPDDDVYLVSDDTQDSLRSSIYPVIYLDTVGNLRKAGRTAFNLNTNDPVGVTSMEDSSQYASDIARWSVAICKNHNANWPADSAVAANSGTHHALADNQDQYWMEELTKKVYKTDPNYTGWIAGTDENGDYTYITVPGRPRVASGYAEPLIDPDNPDESAILSGKPVVANYINFIRQFSIKLCSYDPEHPDDQTKVVWYIKWIKDLPAKSEDWTAKQIKAVEEKKRTLALMKTNLRLVIVKN